MTCSGGSRGKACGVAVRAAARYSTIRDAGFALLGESLFPNAEKVTKNAVPLHPALRFAPGSFAPPLLQGSAYKGHPWPYKPFAASMRLNPLRNDSTHPPERGIQCRLLVRAKHQAKRVCLAVCQLSDNSDPIPLQEAERRRCAGGREAWMPSEERWDMDVPSRRPPERRRREGSFAKQNPDVGVAFFLVTFSWPLKKK